VKIILLKTSESDRTPSVWAEAVSQHFALRGGRCVYIGPNVTHEDEMRTLLDSAMDSSGIVIVETIGETTPIDGLVPDYTITVERNTSWRTDIGHTALQTRLKAWLGSADRIENDRIVADCFEVTSSIWTAEEQQRLDSALLALGWTPHRTPDGRLEWLREHTEQKAQAEA
jgi:hypothetical protein